MFDTPKVTIKIDTDFVTMNVNLYNNVNILVGESGQNKTNFIRAIYDTVHDDEFPDKVFIVGKDINGNNVDFDIYYVELLQDLFIIDGCELDNGCMCRRVSRELLKPTLFLLDDIRGLYYNDRFRYLVENCSDKCIFLMTYRDVDIPEYKGKSSLTYDSYKVKVFENDYHTSYSLMKCNREV